MSLSAPPTLTYVQISGKYQYVYMYVTVYSLFAFCDRVSGIVLSSEANL